ncbi:UDP-glycosyltransferase 86A1-like [Andrographis paniculata]|uniref:UDP-glycosyltransferase 86A1-like n=1 Tax=Andrographis paniculata TaxID=175694 RepID=UPI0021E9A4DD|nr:UDP-glycosyltransferase 86A1-like [Andrographis paniculata]
MADSAAVQLQQPHAIMISLHLQGHINPFIHLALSLASRGFTVTFAHLHFVHRQISAAGAGDPFAGARAAGFDIRYTTLSDGLPIDFDREAHHDQFLHSFRHRLPDIVAEFVGEIIQANPSSPEFFLVADTFSIWAAEVAGKLGLVNVSFWTEPAVVFSLYYHLDLLRRNGDVPVAGRWKNVDYLPGIPSINTKDFVSYLHDSELGPIHHLLFDSFQAVRSADFVLCNTPAELEPAAISGLNETVPFYAIGPMVRESESCEIARSFLPESDCTEWLNSQPAGGVLYVSFGSFVKIDREVIGAVAGGLLRSGVRFLWVLRPGMVDSGDGDGGGSGLPEGFEIRVRGKGKVVTWCNQNQVLGNPATGGFLTHCGWNSILESIWHGVPMICFPVFTDQITNRKLVVEDWKVGVNLSGVNGGSLKEEEVAEKIGGLMEGEMRKGLKEEVEKVGKVLQAAAAENGSAAGNFDRFAAELSEQLQRRRRRR